MMMDYVVIMRGLREEMCIRDRSYLCPVFHPCYRRVFQKGIVLLRSDRCVADVHRPSAV